MSRFKRREFLKVSAGVAAGAAPVLHLGQGRERAVEQHAGEGREAAGVALEALRPGRRGPVLGEREEVQREVRRRGARRHRGLGGRASEGRGGREHRRGAGHHPVDQRRRQPLSREAARRHRRLHVPRHEVRRLVSGVRAYLQAGRQELDRPAARRRGRVHRLPREPHEGGRLRHVPERHRRLPEAVQGAEGEGHAARLRARQRHRRRQHLVATGCCGRSAASSSTRTTRS